MDRMKHVVVVVPVNADEDIAEHIAEEHWHERRESVRIGVVRHLHLPYHDRDDDGDHAVGERFQSSFGHVTLPPVPAIASPMTSPSVSTKSSTATAPTRYAL